MSDSVHSQSGAQGQYVLWLAMTKGERIAAGWGTTEEAFAKQIQVSSRTLRRWRGDPKFTKQIMSEISSLVAPRLRAVVESLLAKVENDRDVAAARLLLEATGAYRARDKPQPPPVLVEIWRPSGEVAAAPVGGGDWLASVS